MDTDLQAIEVNLEWTLVQRQGSEGTAPSIVLRAGSEQSDEPCCKHRLKLVQYIIHRQILADTYSDTYSTLTGIALCGLPLMPPALYTYPCIQSLTMVSMCIGKSVISSYQLFTDDKEVLTPLHAAQHQQRLLERQDREVANSSQTLSGFAMQLNAGTTSTATS